MAKIERLLLCYCEGSMKVDATSASAALGGADVQPVNALCTSDIDVAEAALKGNGMTMIACGQMASLFEELADELGAEDQLATVDIRDRAGWTDDGDAFPKQAALLAEAALPRPQTPTKEIASEGTCLILGRSDVTRIVAVPEAAILLVKRIADSPAAEAVAEAVGTSR